MTALPLHTGVLLLFLLLFTCLLSDSVCVHDCSTFAYRRFVVVFAFVHLFTIRLCLCT